MTNKKEFYPRRNKSFENQNQYYECEDFKYFMIDRWIMGYNIYVFYMELSIKCRFEFISWLLHEKPHSDWSKIILYLLNPVTKRNEGNRYV